MDSRHLPRHLVVLTFSGDDNKLLIFIVKQMVYDIALVIVSVILDILLPFKRRKCLRYKNIHNENILNQFWQNTWCIIILDLNYLTRFANTLNRTLYCVLGKSSWYYSNFQSRVNIFKLWIFWYCYHILLHKDKSISRMIVLTPKRTNYSNKE
jgi:hypothetical protein